MRKREGAGDEKRKKEEGKEEEKGREIQIEIFKAVIDKWHMTLRESS